MSDPVPPLDETFLNLPEPPSSGDRLFSTAEDWWNNACLNWLHDGWGLYASGYKEAGDLLVSQAEARAGSVDSLVYPTVFLYRQYVELTLKDLIRQARQLLDIRDPFPKTHRIDQLWEISRSLFEKTSPEDSQRSHEVLENISRLVREFSAADPTSMAFRYPEDKTGRASLSGLRYINLRNVRDVIDKMSVILEGASAQISENLSIKHEMQAEYRDGAY